MMHLLISMNITRINYYIILINILFVNITFSQNWLYNNYNSTTLNNFRNDKLFKETINFDNIDYPRLNAAIFFVTNEARVKNNLPPALFNKSLEDAATAHSKRMVRMNFFDHIDLFNNVLKTPNDRYKFAGISNPYAAENIATPFAIKYEEGIVIYPLDSGNNYFSYSPRGTPIPNHTYLSLSEEVVDMWMNSEDHRKNILNKDALQLGCGTYFYRERGNNIPKFMATQDFQLYEKIIPIDK
ncbi:MAG: hypothetical protein A2V66_03925 [Ignavibacteria bacterium RBG_13_36_8]|nr:MAG: hypothetical protein A2V66_03925 [Ignavibacteria bacterium RBG_13_36_8]